MTAMEGAPRTETGGWRRVIAAIALVMLLASCANAPVETAPTNNKDVRVDRLFDKDGCTVYRFDDGGHLHYYVVCGVGFRGQTMTDYSYYVSTGKSGYMVFVNDDISTVWP